MVRPHQGLRCSIAQGSGASVGLALGELGVESPSPDGPIETGATAGDPRETGTLECQFDVDARMVSSRLP